MKISFFSGKYLIRYEQFKNAIFKQDEPRLIS